LYQWAHLRFPASNRWHEEFRTVRTPAENDISDHFTSIFHRRAPKAIAPLLFLVDLEYPEY
jgi:hypothetical protein